MKEISIPKLVNTDRRYIIVCVGPLLIFAIFLMTQGLNAFQIYSSMINSVFGNSYGFGEVIIKTTPLIFAALATVVSSKAGLVNVGAEGQLQIGALFTTFVGLYVVNNMPGIVGIIIMAISGIIGGALWGGIAAFLKIKGRMNETITTVILNYIAFYVISYFVFGLLKDPKGFNWPYSSQLNDRFRLPSILGTRVNIGIVLALLSAIIVWYVLSKTKFGFKLRVIGGNATAGLHAGYNVARTQFITMLISGGIAGFAGMIEIAGIEGRLRQNTGVQYGYLGFLAAWMAWNNPLMAIVSAFIIGLINVAGNSLQITSGLPASSVQILMSLVLIAILSVGRKKKC